MECILIAINNAPPHFADPLREEKWRNLQEWPFWTCTQVLVVLYTILNYRIGILDVHTIIDQCSKNSLSFICCLRLAGSHKTDKYIVERFLVAVDCWDFLQSNVTYRQGVFVCVHVFGCALYSSNVHIHVGAIR